MKRAAVLALLNDDPFAQQLLNSHIPARLGYVAEDGTPRVIPIAFHWTGEQFVLATPEGARKIASLQANPAVALTIDTDTQPPTVLLVRGTVEVSMVDGVVPEYLLANRKMFPAEQFEGFREQVTALYDRMARIALTPTWATVHDFETRIPQRVREIVEQKMGAGDPVERAD